MEVKSFKQMEKEKCISIFEENGYVHDGSTYFYIKGNYAGRIYIDRGHSALRFGYYVKHNPLFCIIIYVENLESKHIEFLEEFFDKIYRIYKIHPFDISENRTLFNFLIQDINCKHFIYRRMDSINTLKISINLSELWYSIEKRED